MNAVIACGGTGGHLSRHRRGGVLRDRGHEVMLLISEKDIDALRFPTHEFQVEKLRALDCRRLFSGILWFPHRFYESLSLCRSLYRKFKPQVVLGMVDHFHGSRAGGRIRGIATFIHESNAVPGKANR